MKEIAIISGKGGTGKTTVVSSLAAIIDNKVMVDCDVDAADLYILLKPQIRKVVKFSASSYASIDKKECTECNLCREVCRFDAIDELFNVSKLSCEGCDFCRRVCPVDAIKMIERESGEWYVSDTKYGPMVHAKLYPGEENSGKLVTLIRTRAKLLATETFGPNGYVLIDGPPGIGCSVISTLTGVSLVVIVTEPTPSGIADMKRALSLAQHFERKIGIVINKYDINVKNTLEIENYARNEGISIFGKIPFDKNIVNALKEALPYPEYRDDAITQVFRKIWGNLRKEL